MRAVTIGKGAALVVCLACGGASPEAASEARGAPPDNHDTTLVAPDSNPSAAADTLPAQPAAPIVHLVNTGPHGMAATTRWLLSPDQRSLIVVEDAVGVEAEPVPDGVLFASEHTGAVVQVNGVWDVTPSPDWSRIAWGRAFVFRSGEADSIPRAEWERFLGWLPEDVTEPTIAAMLRRASAYTFPVSGMSYAKAIALTQVLDVAQLTAGRLAVVEAPAVRLEGWRVRWTPGGDTLAIGAAPRMVQDDADASRWTYVRTRPPRTYRDSAGVAPASRRFAPPAWVTGPTIDVSIAVDMNAERHVPSLAATVHSAGGRIVVERRGARTEVGPGAALAATRDGRFIAALRPKRGAGEFDHKYELVVYELAP
jgi:hypothetical protein